MKDILIPSAAEMGTPIDELAAENFEKYASLLCEWNEKMNLTAITEKNEIAVKHFLDSITALVTGKVGKKVIDVGCGAGFPGLPLKIARPEIELTLLDSLNKRIKFLNEVVSQLGLSDVKTVHMRAEDGARIMRESFDTAVSRAVANMSVLSEYCLPYVRVGGYFLALKGPLADEELIAAERAIKILGGEVEEVKAVTIPQSELSHKIIVVKKVRHTPMQYPRKAGIATKTPIESCYNPKKAPKK